MHLCVLIFHNYFLKNGIPLLNLHLKSMEILLFLLNSNSAELELHKGTEEKSYLSVLSGERKILLDV